MHFPYGIAACFWVTGDQQDSPRFLKTIHTFGRRVILWRWRIKKILKTDFIFCGAELPAPLPWSLVSGCHHNILPKKKFQKKIRREVWQRLPIDDNSAGQGRGAGSAWLMMREKYLWGSARWVWNVFWKNANFCHCGITCWTPVIV